MCRQEREASLPKARCSKSSLVQTLFCWEQVTHRAARAVSVKMSDCTPSAAPSWEEAVWTWRPSLVEIRQLTHIQTSELWHFWSSFYPKSNLQQLSTLCCEKPRTWIQGLGATLLTVLRLLCEKKCSFHLLNQLFNLFHICSIFIMNPWNECFFPSRIYFAIWAVCEELRPSYAEATVNSY